MQSDHQRAIAAKTAAATFTKYPRWFDPFLGEWRAAYLHPLYHHVRKRWWMQYEYLLPDEERYRLPEIWAVTAGWYDLLRFVELYLPPRPPSHELAAVRSPDGSPLFYWRYLKPSARDLMHHEESRRANEMFCDPPDRTEFRPLPAGYFLENPPRWRRWARTPADLPDGLGFSMPPLPAEHYVSDPPFFDLRSWWER